MADRVAGDQSTDPDVMRWCRQGCTDPEVHARCWHHDAETITRWVARLGGEARYEPEWTRIEYPWARLLIRTPTGWEYIAPGQGLALTDEWFPPGTWTDDEPDPPVRVFCLVPAEEQR